MWDAWCEMHGHGQGNHVLSREAVFEVPPYPSSPKSTLPWFVTAISAPSVASRVACTRCPHPSVRMTIRPAPCGETPRTFPPVLYLPTPEMEIVQHPFWDRMTNPLKLTLPNRR